MAELGKASGASGGEGREGGQVGESLELSASEELNRRIIESMSGGLVHVRKDGAILAANAEALRILGLSYDAITQRYTQDFAPETFLEDGSPCDPTDYPVTKALMTGKRQGPLTIGIRHQDGGVYWAVFTAAALFGPGGKDLIGAVVTFVDVTEQKRAAAALQRSEELLRSVLGSAPNAIATTDADGRLLFVSDGPPTAPAGELAWSSLVASDQLRAEAAFRAVMTTGVRQSYEGTDVRGTQWRVHVGPRYEGEVIAGATYVAWDVTEQKRLETRLAIADRMASIGTLSAAVAHEVNNPLTYVLANVEWALRKATERGDAATISALGGALDGLTRIRSVVSDLGTFSHIDDEQPVSIDVKQLVETAIRMAQPEIRHRARLTRRFSEVPPVVGVEGRLGQVFLNLLVNAAQAISEGDAERNEIVVATFTDDAGNVVVEVSDTGQGISPDLVPRIFEPFVTTKARGVGTGLGLYICRNVIGALGGELMLRATSQRGTTFRVVLPPGAGVRATAAPPSEPPRSARRLKVLVADDEAAIGHALKLFLEAHEVDVVGSGRAAIARLGEGHDYDAIFCDLVMPDLTGMDVFDWVSQNRPESKDRLIFMTGGAFTLRARTFLETIKNEVIEKPFALKEIERAVMRRRG